MDGSGEQNKGVLLCLLKAHIKRLLKDKKNNKLKQLREWLQWRGHTTDTEVIFFVTVNMSNKC